MDTQNNLQQVCHTVLSYASPSSRTLTFRTVPRLCTRATNSWPT